jgi:hypothetical protein
MRRYVYCPSNDHIASAEELAIKTNLPILIGDSEESRDVVFDRGTVSIIKIPEKKDLIILYKEVPIGFHQCIRYINEYKTLKNNIKLLINNELIKPLYEENHAVRYNFLCQTSGEHSCSISVNDSKEEEFSFVVN